MTLPGDVRDPAAGVTGDFRGVLPTVEEPCSLCGATSADPVWSSPDRAFSRPGVHTVARCRSCGFLYQRPRVRDDALSACYPPDYSRHQEASIRYPLSGSPGRVRAVRYALAEWLGYRHLRAAAGDRIGTRLRARLELRRLRWECPPWVGDGRYLDVGCGSGASLGRARSVGWRVTGIEMDATAAARARRLAEAVHTGDILSVPLPAGQFDVVTAFHVLEHLPDPVGALRRMLAWLAPGGLLIVDVPNAGGGGARLFGRAWSGLELPRHLSHFTPETLARAIALAGGDVVWWRHRAKPRHYLRSLQNALHDRGWRGVGRLAGAGWARGVLKLILEVMLPVVSAVGRGEEMRVGVRRRG